jgi:hypothetical protein
MAKQIDIYRTANALIEWHGPVAAIQASMKAEVLLEAGDIEGLAAWKCILAAVDELLTTDRLEGVETH